MALVGLEKIHYANWSLNEQGKDTYGDPTPVAEAIQAELGVNVVKQTLFGDNKPCYSVSRFGGGTLKITVADVPLPVLADWLGLEMSTDKKTLLYSADVRPKPVAIGFIANKAGGVNKYVWLFKVLFSLPAEAFQTMGESIEFKVPELEGEILTDSNGNWKIEHQSDGNTQYAKDWFSEVQKFVKG